MALWVCANDGVPYSVGAKECPECGATEHFEDGSPEHLASLAKAKKPAKPAQSTGSSSASSADAEAAK